MRVLVASSVDADALRVMRGRHDVVCAINAPASELAAAIADREALVFRSGVNIDAGLMARAPALRLLIRAGSGLDNLDLPYAESRGMRLVRIPEPGARAVAELAFGMMLSLARQIGTADALLRTGRWAKSDLEGYLLSGKTLGIVGAGNIGSVVGRMAAAWGMRVLGCVEHPSVSRAADLGRLGIELADFGEVLAQADFLSVNVPRQSSTENLIDADALARMRRGAFLVNLSRGGVVDETALLASLESGHLRGAGLDVHAREGAGCISPLAGLSNVILTPHIGASTVDSQREIGRRVLEVLAGAH
jgi:phosphoglycerate dehydrogenase-like enzyme